MKAYVIKQADPHKAEIGGNTFYIYPFSAFASVNLTGELSSLVAPLLGTAAPMVMNSDKPLDANISMIVSSLSSAFNGDKLEAVMRKLLVAHGNVYVDVEDEDDPCQLNDDLVNLLFCCNTQDMFLLAAKVIEVNFSGFFEKLRTLFGSATRGRGKKTTSNGTASSTAANSAT